MNVLITGAGGSIGSELARQLSGNLTLVDRSESALFAVGRDVPGELRLANVVSRKAMRRLVVECQPDIIYHVAACKHVPLMETHPSEAVQVNIGGTLSMLDAAEAVERFVLVSTDKAVEPVSVMGATKRIAEWLVAERARSTGKAYVSVRFGNVIGTAGSVIETFRLQLAQGQPLTITHPDASRYFMSLSEAVSLIVLASDIGGSSGEVYILDMGEQRTIRDVADEVIREAGLDPVSVSIVYTGLRPGEKLTESLYHPHETIHPVADKVSVAHGDHPPPDLDALVAELLHLADGEHDDLLRERLAEITADAAREVAA